MISSCTEYVQVYRTRLVLETVLSQLPQESSENVRRDIKDRISDSDLYDPENHLIIHILTPSTCLCLSGTVEAHSRL